jgi:hypothetical protein
MDCARGGDAAALDILLGKLRPWVRLLVRPRLRPNLDASDWCRKSSCGYSAASPAFAVKRCLASSNCGEGA